MQRIEFLADSIFHRPGAWIADDIQTRRAFQASSSHSNFVPIALNGKLRSSNIAAHSASPDETASGSPKRTSVSGRHATNSWFRKLASAAKPKPTSYNTTASGWTLMFEPTVKVPHFGAPRTKMVCAGTPPTPQLASHRSHLKTQPSAQGQGPNLL